MPARGNGLKEILNSSQENALTQVSDALHVPGGYYTSPEIYELERNKVFLSDWLMIGREEEFAHPGDYATFDIVGEPVLVVRDKDKKLRAFSNICRHRGAQIARGSGNASRFSCPYHAWTYDLTGKLVGAPYLKDSSFDRASCRLPSHKVEVWRGNVFMTFDPSPVDFQTFIAEFENDFGFLRMEECALAFDMRFDLNCNWKLVPENFMDFYHVNVVHARSFGSRFKWTDKNVSLRKNGGLTIWYDASPPTPDGKSLFGKMPWLDGQTDSFACLGFLPPNCMLIARSDCVRLYVTWPTSADTCYLKQYQLFPKSYSEDEAFEEKAKVYEDFQRVIVGEDEAMVESMHEVFAQSKYFEPGPMVNFELTIHNFINAHVDRLSAELD